MISQSEIERIIKEESEGPSLDYKEDLVLNTNGDKAEFIKDIISLANSAKVAHIIIGVEDETHKPIDLRTSHNATQLNDILKNRCDPPISLEYVEEKILGYKVGVIEIHGDNPPYIISVNDRFGGKRTCGESCHINRGTVFVRNNDKNEGASREHIEKMYENKVKYITLQADLELNHEVLIKPLKDSKEVNIKFFVINKGEVIATDACIWMQFANVREILQTRGICKNVSNINEDFPTIQALLNVPVFPQPSRVHCDGVIVKVDNDVESIEARLIIGAPNMRVKDGPYVISLKELKKEQI